MGRKDRSAAVSKPQGFRPDGLGRWGRIAINQIETMPLALMILWASLHATAGGTLSVLLFVVYTAARIFFAGAYLAESGKRGLGFAVGHLCVVVSGLAGSRSGSTVPMLCSLALYILNMLALLKSINPENHFKEDKLDEQPELFVNTQLKDKDNFQRWSRVAANQQEQFPMACLVLWAAHYTGVDASIPFIAYTVLRATYAVGYINHSTALRGLGFIGGQLSVVAAMWLGGIASFPMFATSLLYLMNMAALIKTADPNNQPTESPLNNDKIKADYKAKIEAMGFNRPLRVCVNQLEQFPMALLSLWAACQLTALTGGAAFAVGAFVAYTLCRVLYAGFYLQAIGPARQLSFALSVLSVLSSCIVGILYSA